MKNLLNWIIERTPQQKHLKDLYERALKDVEETNIKINNAYGEIMLLRDNNKSITKLLLENTMLKEFNEGSLKRANNLEKQKKQIFKQLQHAKVENEKLKNNLSKSYETLEKIKKECLKPTNENFTVENFVQAKDEELTEAGNVQRDILKIIKEALK